MSKKGNIRISSISLLKSFLFIFCLLSRATGKGQSLNNYWQKHFWDDERWTFLVVNLLTRSTTSDFYFIVFQLNSIQKCLDLKYCYKGSCITRWQVIMLFHHHFFLHLQPLKTSLIMLLMIFYHCKVMWIASKNSRINSFISRLLHLRY